MWFHPQPRFVVAALAVTSLSAAACGGDDGVTTSDFCCTTIESCEVIGADPTPCTDPELPYCDDNGDFGPRRTCIPDPESSIVMTWPSDGFLVIDGPPEQWWTQIPVTTLSGSVEDDRPITVVAQIAGTDYPADVAGSVWMVTLPEGALPSTPTDVTIRGRDGAGNERTITHTIAVDGTPPTVTPHEDATTTVRDERIDTISFDAHRPDHTHVASDSDAVLGGASCPGVYKHVTLLDEGEPRYVTENVANPIHWVFDVTDTEGVGVDPEGTAYRVRLASAPPGTYLTDWIPLSGTEATDGETYEFSLYRRDAAGSPLLPELGTTDGGFEVELRGRDRFGRETVETRCFTNHPLGPAVELGGVLDPVDHTNVGTELRALFGVALQTSGYPVAAVLTNPTSFGGTLLEFDVWHTSAEPAYLTLDLTPPSGTYGVAGQVSWALQSTNGASIPCGNDEPVGDCAGPNLPALTDPGRTGSLNGVATYTLRFFDATPATWVELAPCVGCDATATRREFELPPANGTPRHYRVLAIIKDVSEELSLAADGTGAPPYSEATLTYNSGSASVQITGKLETTETGCTAYSTPNPNTGNYSCIQTKTYRKYRMYKSISLAFSTLLRVTPEIAATSALPTLSTPARSLIPDSLNTSESAVPTQIP